MAEAPALVIAAYGVGLAALALGPRFLRKRIHSGVRNSIDGPSREWPARCLGGSGWRGSDFASSGEAFWGDLLAIEGAVMAAGCLVTSPSARGSLDLATHVFMA